MSWFNNHLYNDFPVVELRGAEGTGALKRHPGLLFWILIVVRLQNRSERLLEAILRSQWLPARRKHGFSSSVSFIKICFENEKFSVHILLQIAVMSLVILTCYVVYILYEKIMEIIEDVNVSL